MVKSKVIYALLALFAYIGYNIFCALTIQSQQLKLDAAGIRNVANDISTDPYILAKKLSDVIKFQTVSYEDRTQINYDEFIKLQNYLAQQYPLVHKHLKLEKVSNYSLLYTWQGTEKDLKGFMLAGHLDVVPIETGTESNWSYPPFSGTVAEGYIWGRGSLDDKNAVIGILEAIEYLLGRGFHPRHTIYIAFGHDEEISGFDGARVISQILQKRGVRLEFILDEGLLILDKGKVPLVDSSVAIVGTSEKGYATFELSVECKGGHSSMPVGDSAIIILGQALSRLEANPFPADTSIVHEFHSHIAAEMGFLGKILVTNRFIYDVAIKQIAKTMNALAAQIKTTLAFTKFNSGIKDNVIPSRATATINLRILPVHTVKYVKEYIKSVINDERVTITLKQDALEPAPFSSCHSLPYQILSKTIRQVYTQTLVSPSLMMANTDTRHYWNLTDNIYRFNPIVVDDTSGIHATNEKVDVIHFSEMVNFYNHLIRNADNDIIQH